MKSLLTFVVFFASIELFSQVILTDRHPDWRLIAENVIFNEPATIVNAKDFGAIGDGQTDDFDAITNAIASLNGKLGMIYLPSGNYLINSTLYIPDSTILQGNTSDSTTLTFDLNQQAIDCISVSKGQGSRFAPVDLIGPMGSNWFTMDDISGFTTNDYIELRETNGSWDVVPIDWAENSVGQITQVEAISGDTVFLKSPFRIGFEMELQPEVRKITPVVNAGVMCLKIKRADSPAEGAGSNIVFNYAAHCMVNGVESDTSVGSHISINMGANILISGCYIHHAFTYDGTGTRGYGVTLSQHSSECLVENNIFKHLRHAMMVKTGSNGNIFAYNFSIEPYRSETIHDFSGDISMHGHFAFANLFEGNIVQNIIIDHYWGPSGPFNTLFRNRAELYGIYMTSSNLLETNRQNFVGNEVTKPNYPYGQYVLTGTDHFEFGNNIDGTIIPAGTDNLSDSSYFLNNKPAYWKPNQPWPSVGIPNVLNTGSIPARDRYISGEQLTHCGPDSTSTNILTPVSVSPAIEIWPNPANDILNIRFNNHHGKEVRITLFSMTGILVWNEFYPVTDGMNHATISLPYIVMPGTYLLKIESETHSVFKKLCIVR
ncbi:MAG: T9SS type A sorting domain-containing protein [Bacteroidales bacterium]|nr:T9SS type A sorting domain-containing protein [Bacteroidales bacterium]